MHNGNNPEFVNDPKNNNGELRQNASQTNPVIQPMLESVNTQMIAQMSEQLQSLNNQVNLLKSQLEKSNGSADVIKGEMQQQDLSTEQSNSAVNDILDEAQRAAKAKAEMAEQMAVIENRFHAQDVDPNWAQSTENRLQEVFSEQSMHDHTIQSVECRASLCKLDIIPQQEGGDPGGFHIALRDQISDVLPAGAMQPNSSGGVTVYLAKDANDLNVALSTH